MTRSSLLAAWLPSARRAPRRSRRRAAGPRGRLPPRRPGPRLVLPPRPLRPPRLPERVVVLHRARWQDAGRPAPRLPGHLLQGRAARRAAPALDSAWATAGASWPTSPSPTSPPAATASPRCVWRDAPLLAGFGAAARTAGGLGPGAARHPGPLDPRPRPPEGAWRLAARDDRRGGRPRAHRHARAARSSCRGPTATAARRPPRASPASTTASRASRWRGRWRSTAGRRRCGARPGWTARSARRSSAPGQVGWDWFALRLADGRDLMLYLLRRADGAVDWRYRLAGPAPDGAPTAPRPGGLVGARRPGAGRARRAAPPTRRAGASRSPRPGLALDGGAGGGRRRRTGRGA